MRWRVLLCGCVAGAALHRGARPAAGGGCTSWACCRALLLQGLGGDGVLGGACVRAGAAQRCTAPRPQPLVGREAKRARRALCEAHLGARRAGSWCTPAWWTCCGRARLGGQPPPPSTVWSPHTPHAAGRPGWLSTLGWMLLRRQATKVGLLGRCCLGPAAGRARSLHCPRARLPGSCPAPGLVPPCRAPCPRLALKAGHVHSPSPSTSPRTRSRPRSGPRTCTRASSHPACPLGVGGWVDTGTLQPIRAGTPTPG